MKVGPGNDRLPTIGPAPDRLFRRPQDAFLHTVGQAVGPLRWLACYTWTLDLPPLSTTALTSEKKPVRNVTVPLACHWDPFCGIRCSRSSP